jgi:hypothetical protein
MSLLAKHEFDGSVPFEAEPASVMAAVSLEQQKLLEVQEALPSLEIPAAQN